jgi:arylsulfatase A-like enzyme
MAKIVKIKSAFVTILLLTAVFVVNGCVGNKKMARQCDIPISNSKKNVILITVSTLRADHVGCMGYGRDTTPNFDVFAKKNILFKNAFATSSWAMPSMGSIFTSRYPSQHGATHINKSLGADNYTLAQMLKDHGYYTIGFCCNPRLSSDYGFARGFDLYDDYSASIILQSMSFEKEDSLETNKRRTNDLVNDAAMRWLKNNTHKPFFLSVHYYDNHWDYLPPSPYNTLYDPNYKGTLDGRQIAREPLYSNRPSDRDVEHMIALYDGQVRQTDADLGEMLRALENMGLMSNSIVIIMGDHGDSFYEHGHTSHHGVYDELVHVPLAISLPNDANNVQVIDSLASGVDIVPTILELLDLSVPPACEGKSLKPAIEGKQKSDNDFVRIEYTGGAVPDSFALRTTRYKFVWENDRLFAYDLLNDPSEQKRISEQDFSGQMNRHSEIFRMFLKAESKSE